MLHASIRRPALAMILGAVLLSSPASAASRSWNLAEEVGREVWSWLNGLLAGSQRAEVKHGCSLDPDGVPRCEPASAAPAPKHGCTIDPSGTPRCDP